MILKEVGHAEYMNMIGLSIIIPQHPCFARIDVLEPHFGGRFISSIHPPTMVHARSAIASTTSYISTIYVLLKNA